MDQMLLFAAAGRFAEIYLAENMQRREKVGKPAAVCTHTGLVVQSPTA